MGSSRSPVSAVSLYVDCIGIKAMPGRGRRRAYHGHFRCGDSRVPSHAQMSSSTTIKLPGFGLPVNDTGPIDRFPNAIQNWAGHPITVRERTMMAIMNSITDKPEWSRKVFDESIARKWRQEAMEDENWDVTEKMLDWVSTSLVFFCLYIMSLPISYRLHE